MCNVVVAWSISCACLHAYVINRCRFFQCCPAVCGRGGRFGGGSPRGGPLGLLGLFGADVPSTFGVGTLMPFSAGNSVVIVCLMSAAWARVLTVGRVRAQYSMYNIIARVASFGECVVARCL